MAPPKLFRLCLRYVALIIEEACESIGSKYGSYDADECKKDVTCIKHFIQFNVPRHIMDDLHNEFKIWVIEYDPRIYLAAIMNKNTKRLSVRPELDRPKFKFDSGFWDKQLCNCKDIVQLDFNGTCTDEILEVVSQHCSVLEYIDIQSEAVEVEDETISVKCKCLVTDAGIKHLEKCVHLKIIIVDWIIYKDGLYGISVRGIRKLLKCLPSLRLIDCFDEMGIVISEDMNDVKTLALTYISDFHPDATHIYAASTLCHNLRHLHLVFVENLDVDDLNDCDQNVASVFSAITNSKLCVPHYGISFFKINDAFLDFISIKGQFIISLTLQIERISNALIEAVGTNCCNIKKLDLREYLMIRTDVMENNTFQSSEIKFTTLEELSLSGKSWNSIVILPVVLSHAIKVKELNVYECKNNSDDSVDKAIYNILMKNPLIKLCKVRTDSALSAKTIRRLLQLTKLKLLSFQKNSLFIPSTEIDALIEELNAKGVFLML